LEVELPLFGRRNDLTSRLPEDIAQRMEVYGRFEFDPQSFLDDTPPINELIYQPLYPIASADGDAFIAGLAAAVLPVGGWAVFGGQRAVRDLTGDRRPNHPGYVSMLDAAIRFVISQGYGPHQMAITEREEWKRLRPGEELPPGRP
jgi:hypothetical protein